MSYKMYWFDKEILGYYFSGAITKDFGLLKENEKLLQWAGEERDIAALFLNERNMLLLREFVLYNPSLEESEELFYLLDEGLLEFIQSNPHEPKISLYVGIAALQYFQFDTLKDIMTLSDEELQGTSQEEREEIRDIQKIFRDMSPKEREAFLEQELFCYTKSELTHWLDNIRIEGEN